MAGIPNDSSYEWVVPDTNATQCKIKVIAHGYKLRYGEDESDSCFSISKTGIAESPTHRPYSLSIYPNPFLKVTSIRYQVARKGKVSIKIYDLSGRLVKTLVDGLKCPGYYSVDWSPRNSLSGIYFVKMEAGSFKATKKLILVR